MAARGLEIWVRRESEPLGVGHRPEHKVLHELEWRRNRWRGKGPEVDPDEAAQIAPAYPLGADRVLDAQTERVDQLAADTDAIVPLGASDQRKSHALRPVGAKIDVIPPFASGDQ